MKHSKETVDQFYKRFLTLSRNMSHKEAYSLCERWQKKKTGNRLYANYHSFQVNISKRRKKGLLNCTPNSTPIILRKRLLLRHI